MLQCRSQLRLRCSAGFYFSWARPYGVARRCRRRGLLPGRLFGLNGYFLGTQRRQMEFYRTLPFTTCPGSDRSWSIDGFKPANVLLASVIRGVTRDPINRAQFFFSFESDLPASPWGPLSVRASKVGDQVQPKNSCGPRLHCAQSSWAVLYDSPRRHSRSGRD